MPRARAASLSSAARPASWATWARQSSADFSSVVSRFVGGGAGAEVEVVEEAAGVEAVDGVVAVGKMERRFVGRRRGCGDEGLVLLVVVEVEVEIEAVWAEEGLEAEVATPGCVAVLGAAVEGVAPTGDVELDCTLTRSPANVYTCSRSGAAASAATRRSSVVAAAGAGAAASGAAAICAHSASTSMLAAPGRRAGARRATTSARR